MRFVRDKTLLPCTPADMRFAEYVPFLELPTCDLLLFDETVSDFFFEFEPAQDIERFLQHAHMSCIANGKFIASQEDLLAIAALTTNEPSETLIVNPATELPAPFRMIPINSAFDAIASGGEFRGQVTVCSCHIGGCFSQYVWARDSLCLAMFTIDGACLTEVAWLPFRFAIQTQARNRPVGLNDNADPGTG